MKKIIKKCHRSKIQRGGQKPISRGGVIKIETGKGVYTPLLTCQRLRANFIHFLQNLHVRLIKDESGKVRLLKRQRLGDQVEV